MKKIDFSTILIIAAIAAAIWYFTKPKTTKTEAPAIVGDDEYSTNGPGNQIFKPLVVKPALKRPFVSPFIVRPNQMVQVSALPSNRQRFLGRG